MAAKAKGKGTPEPRTEEYVHAQATRPNNPEAGLHSADKVKVPPRVKYQYDPHLDPQLVWASKAERSEIEVETVSLHKHEIVRPQDIISMVQGEAAQGSLFGDARLPIHKAVEFYKHDQTWMNRMVLGDSLLVMNSLLHKENLGGKVQTIYIDPPYGIAYNSNFQPRIDKREVQDGKDDCNRSRGCRMSEGYGWQQRRSLGVSRHRTERLHEEVEDAPPLGTQRHHNGEDPLHEATARLAVGAEAGLAPHHAVADLPLGEVVGRLHPLDRNEGPEGVLHQQDLVAGPRGLRVRARATTLQRVVHRAPQPPHLLAQPGAIAGPVAYTMPPAEQRLRRAAKLTADGGALTAAVDHPLPVAVQVRPARLPLIVREPRVRHVAVADGEALEVRAHQLLRGLRAAVPVDAEAGHAQRRHHPEPRALPRLAPARLVHVDHRLRLHVGPGLGDGVFERLGDHALAVAHRAGGHLDLKHLAEHLRDGALADAVAPRQERYERDQARTEGPRGNSLRKTRKGARVAAGAGEAMEAVLINPSQHLGELNDLMAKGLGVVAGKRLAAAIAVGRVEVQDLVDLLDRDEIASMPRVLGLSAALLLGGLGGWRGDARPVGARGLAAVAGVEPELLPQQRVLRTQRDVLTLQLDHACFERGDARRHRDQERTNRSGRRREVLVRDGGELCPDLHPRSPTQNRSSLQAVNGYAGCVLCMTRHKATPSYMIPALFVEDREIAVVLIDQNGGPESLRGQFIPLLKRPNLTDLVVEVARKGNRHTAMVVCDLSQTTVENSDDYGTAVIRDALARGALKPKAIRASVEQRDNQTLLADLDWIAPKLRLYHPGLDLASL
jgi:hypothetical protein